MPFSLFPDDHAPIEIRQGSVGDCYMLAAVDSLCQTREGRQSFINRFSILPDGRVCVRLKRNDSSGNVLPNLKALGALGPDGYDYHQTVDEDIFVLSHTKLTQIQSRHNGVQTNCLALKIFEHILSYYYDRRALADAASHVAAPYPGASVERHNVGVKFDKKAHVFIGELLGIQSHKTLTMDEVVKLKAIYHDAPVYVAIDFGEPGVDGKFPASHALRVAEIRDDGRGGRSYILVNPWDNMRDIKAYAEGDIQCRNPQFSYFDTSERNYKLLTDILLNLPTDEARYVYSHHANGDEHIFLESIKALLVKHHRMDLWSNQYEERMKALRVIADHIKLIKQFDNRIPFIHDENQIVAHWDYKHRQLFAIKNDPAFVWAKSKLGYIDDPYEFTRVMNEKKFGVDNAKNYYIDVVRHNDNDRCVALCDAEMNAVRVDFGRIMSARELYDHYQSLFFVMINIRDRYSTLLKPEHIKKERNQEIQTLFNAAYEKMYAAYELQRKMINEQSVQHVHVKFCEEIKVSTLLCNSFWKRDPIGNSQEHQLLQPIEYKLGY